MRQTNATGQLRPLEKRMNKERMVKRALKIAARATIATELGRQGAMTRGMAVTALAILERDFWGRMKWLFRGK